MIEAMVLAAGRGESFGTTESLVPLAGRPALAKILATLRQATIQRILVVLGEARDGIEAHGDLSTCYVLQEVRSDGS